MKFKFKSLLLVSLSISMLLLSGCGKNNSNNVSDNSNKTNTTDNSTTDNSTANNSTNNNSNGTAAPTNEEYYTYLTDRYNYYFNNYALDTTYDIYVDDFTFDNTYDEFITVYNGNYEDLKRDLVSFKNDLETNVAKGNAEVDKVNAEVITSIDKAIIAVDDYNSTFSEKAKDYAQLSKDEIIKGLRALARAPHDARVELHNLVTDAKNSLGIK